jgi:hypothetical protein
LDLLNDANFIIIKLFKIDLNLMTELVIRFGFIAVTFKDITTCFNFKHILEDLKIIFKLDTIRVHNFKYFKSFTYFDFNFIIGNSFNFNFILASNYFFIGGIRLIIIKVTFVRKFMMYYSNYSFSFRYFNPSKYKFV